MCGTRTCLGKLIVIQLRIRESLLIWLIGVDCFKHSEWRWVRAALFKPEHLGSETRPDDPSVIDGANPTARAHFLLLKTTGALLSMSPSHIKAANSTQAWAYALMAILLDRHPVLEQNERALQILLTQIHFPHLNPSAFPNKSRCQLPLCQAPLRLNLPLQSSSARL